MQTVTTEERDAARALIDAASHCRMCRECGDGPCCSNCGVEQATQELEAQLDIAMVHGREAELLRSGIEKIMADPPGGDDESNREWLEPLRLLLDDVDAGDALAFIEAKYKVTGKTSDGYHTFDELYDHRIALFIALCHEIHERTAPRSDGGHPGRVWRSKLHSDSSSFDGWFIMGIGVDAGEQITYHLPLARWSDTDFLEDHRGTLPRAPNFDGHTSSDVLQRLKQYASPPPQPCVECGRPTTNRVPDWSRVDVDSGGFVAMCKGCG